MSVPDVPLFTVMTTELPDSDHDQSVLITGVNAARCCSLRRQEKREKRARRQVCIYKKISNFFLHFFVLFIY